MSGRLLLLLMLSTIFSCYSNASLCREFPTIHYTINEGLPSNTVYNIYRSRDGFLWLGTDQGVARYNGVRFEKFTTFDGLADNEVFFAQEDLQGRIWFATYNGQLCFYQDGVFHNASNTPYLKLPYKIPFIRMINIENDSSVSIHFFDNIIVNIKNNKSQLIDLKKVCTSPQNPVYLYCYKQTAGTYKIRTFSSFVIFDTSYHIIRYDTLHDEYLYHNFLRTFLQNQNYLANQDGIYDTSVKMLHPFPKDFMLKQKVIQIYRTRKNLFVTTANGLFINDTLQLFSGKRVSCINQDMNGNYWASTLDDGLYLIDKNFDSATVYKDVYAGAATYIFNDKKHFFFTTTNQSLYEFSGEKSRKIIDFNYLLKKIMVNSTVGYYIDSSYRAYSCFYYQVVVADHILSKPVITNYRTTFFTTGAIKKVVVANDALYVNSRTKIYKLPLPKSKADRASELVVSDTSHLVRIFDMNKDADNSVWFATANAMYKVVNDRAVPQTQFHNVTFKAFEFWNNYLIGYTQDNQLAICENANENVNIHFINPQNCIWNQLYSIDSVHFLIGTNNLYRLITIHPGTTKRYTIEPIENPFIPFKAEEISSDGNNCYFLKDGSITCIPISDLLIKPRAPQLFFKSLKTNQNTYRIKNEVAVNFDEAKIIVISFSTLSFGAKDVSYQYSISKDETDNWRELAGEDLNLVNPGFGTYKVKIRAKTITSAFAAPIIFDLRILKPFWAAWWFIASLGIVLITIIGVAVRMRTRSLLREKEKEHDTQIKFMKSEYKALNALMNPHFIFNTLNNVQGLVNRNDKLSANEYLRVFADLVRQNMQNVSNELIPLQKEMELVTNYLRLERLRFKEKLNYSIEIEEGIDLSDILIPPLLVQPLVENSIKHGILPLESRNGCVKIKVFHVNDNLHIEIRDNGVGMAKSMQQHKLYSSFGLENVRTRLDQLSVIQNKKFEIKINEVKDDEQPHFWTVVTIVMSVND